MWSGTLRFDCMPQHARGVTKAKKYVDSDKITKQIELYSVRQPTPILQQCMQEKAR